MHSIYHFPGPPSSLANMTSFYNSVPHSSGISEVSSAPPSPVSGNTSALSAASPGSSSRHGVVVPNRVFVGGIASNTTENELQELFSQFGNIKEIKIISDKGGVCKGYGFVTFETEEEAKKVQHQPDTIVLKERRLNIAPAVMKQQPFGRPYDVAPPAGALLYHNGTTYTFQNGMAFFAASGAAQSPYSLGAARETSMYAAPFGPSQTTTAPAYPQIMYSPYPQPMPYLATGQQYQYPLPFDYFKTAIGPTASQYIYAPSSALNGAMSNSLNGGIGNSSQSPSSAYSQQQGTSNNHNSQAANASAGAAFYHTGGDLYYNGGSHQTPLSLNQHQPMYSIESSPAHSEDWCPEPRQTHTPVVSLLKLHEEGSVEEREITRTPRKSSSQPPFSPGPGGTRPGGAPGHSGARSRRPVPSHGHGRGGRGPSVSLAGQRSASSPHLPSTPNSCIHRSTSLSPSGQVPPAYNGGQHRQHHHAQMPQNQQGYHPRRGGHMMRNSGGKNYMSNSRSNYNAVGSSAQNSNQIMSVAPNSGQNSMPKTVSSPKNPGESVNGIKAASPVTPATPTNPPAAATNSIVKQEKTPLDEGGAGDAPAVRHSLPLSPPSTPSPQESSTSLPKMTGAGDCEDVLQKMQAVAL